MKLMVNDSTGLFVILGIIAHAILHRHEPSTAGRGLAIILVIPFTALVLGGTKALTLYSIVAFTMTYILSLSISIILYRLSPFHSLAHIPGPVLCKVSKLTEMWISWSGKQHLRLQQMHREYGPVVRIGPNDISILDIDAIPAVLGAGGVPKGSYYTARRDPRAPNNLITMSGDEHATRRRIWNRGMSSDALKEYEAFIVSRATQLLRKLEAADGVVDFAAWVGHFSFDLMGDMAFSGGFELMRDGGETTGILHSIGVFAVAASIYCHIPWFAASISTVRFPFRDNMRDFAISNATRRVKTVSTRKDLWYHLMDEAGLEKKKPTLSDVVADGALAIVAGSDTTAMALASLFLLLLSHPEKYQTLQDEIDSTFPAGSDPTDLSKHAQMEYLNACINEALRLHPPVPTGGPRQVPVNSSGKVVANRFIPPGTQIYIAPYVYHRDPHFFPDPDSFRPERWLHHSSESEVNAFIPFSFGPSNCAGKQFARHEMTVVTCLLLHHLSFRLAQGYDSSSWANELRDHFISTRGSLPVIAKPR